MKKNEMNAVLELFKSMSESEQSAIAEQIMQMMAQPQVSKKGCAELIPGHGSETPNCPHCAAKASMGNVVKKGYINGVQRYKCKACGKYFMPTTGTAFARSRKDADTWRKFIQLTISGASIRVCKEECGLSTQIAFDWRHKVLHVFEQNQKATKMSGTVEVDEMLIPVSYKGNHIQGGFGSRKKVAGAINDMPRKSFKRGTDNISRSSKEKACVFCMVENGNKAFFAAVPGVGFMNEEMLSHTVGKHIEKDSAMMLADNYKITRKYFEDNGYKHTILASNTSDNPADHKPEIKGGLHMQHVNAMHHNIRNFLKPYYGVSSKYLSNYIALFIWLKSIRANKQRKLVEKATVTRAAATDCYITRNQIHGRPALPSCA